MLPPHAVPSLVTAAGDFYPNTAIFPHLPRIQLAELRAELFAQAELLVQSGGPFDHIDYHQHLFAVYSPFFEIVRELARHHRTPVRNPLPGTLTGVALPTTGGAQAAITALRRVILPHPIAALRLLPHLRPAAFKRRVALLQSDGVPTPHYFIESFFNNASLTTFQRLLDIIPTGVSELMVHPGTVDNGLLEFGGDYIAPRATELSVLTHPQARAALTAKGIHLVDFSHLIAQAST